MLIEGPSAKASVFTVLFSVRYESEIVAQQP